MDRPGKPPISPTQGAQPSSRLKDYRKRAILTQQEVAEALVDLAWKLENKHVGVNAFMVSRWERGEKRPNTRYRRLLCAFYDATEEELGLCDEPPLARDDDGVATHQFVPIMNGSDHDGSLDAAAILAFRGADRQVGGAYLYPTVVHYLETEIAPRLFGLKSDADPKRTFTAAAALTEMAGWMAHDAGRDLIAEQHFGRALDLVNRGSDQELGTHILASMSHLAHHLNKPDKAIALARTGQEVFRRGPRNPALQACLYAMEARGFAGLGESEECAQSLLRAEKVLGGYYREVPSQWISHFDEGSLSNEAARCMWQLGQWGEAQRQAERVIELRPADRVRSRAFAQLILVRVLMVQDEYDQACVVADETLKATESLGSFLVAEQLQGLQRLFEPRRSNREVSQFLMCLVEALGRRKWLYL